MQRIKKIFFTVFPLVSLGLTACAGQQGAGNFVIASVTEMEEYDEAFSPQREGWLGGDAAHSLMLTPEKRLWIFGDSFIGEVKGGVRQKSPYVNNAIAIEDISKGEPGKITYYWGPDKTAMFPHQPGTPGEYYWPTMATLLDGELYIFCFSISHPDGGFFQIDGTTLLKIPNPLAPPPEWEVKAADMEIGENNLGIHSAVYQKDEYVYMLGYKQVMGKKDAILARMKTQDLKKMAGKEAMEFWVHGEKEPEWSSSSGDYVILFEPGNTETNIQYIEEWDKFFVTTYHAEEPEIYLTWSDALTGPWSKPIVVYRAPEHEMSDTGAISYAARLHPDMSDFPGDLVITYAASQIGEIAKLFTEEGYYYYRPRFLNVVVRPAEAE